MFYRRLSSLIKELFGLKEFKYLRSNLIELNSVAELKKLFGWDLDGIIDDPQIYNFESAIDVNQRRLRDAEVLSAVCRNINTGTILEIGTGVGHSTALMAINAPNAEIRTINILRFKELMQHLNLL